VNTLAGWSQEPNRNCIPSRHSAAGSRPLQLRTLQTMAEIATEKNSTIIFPAQIYDDSAGSYRHVE